MSYQPSKENPYASPAQNPSYPQMPDHQQQHEAPPPYANYGGPPPTQQQPQYHHQQQPQVNYVYVGGGGPNEMGASPSHMVCPQCHQQVTTRVKASAGTITWLTSALCFLFGCVCGCCLLPFCMDGLQDAEHYCPNCNAFLGRYRRMC